MKRNFSDYLTAIVVLVCSGVLLAALTIALSGYRASKPGRTLEIDFADVTGIRLHSEVRYAGAPAGRIVALRHLTADERASAPADKQANAVRVTAELHEHIPALPADITTSLASETLLSDKFVALSAGSAGAPRLANGAILQGKMGGSLDEAIGSIGPLVISVEKALASIDPVMTKAGEALDTIKGGMDEALPKFTEVAEAAKAAAASADAVLKRTDALIAENEGGVKENLSELKQSLNELQTVLGTANGFVGRTDRDLQLRMKELGVVMQNLKVVTTQAKAVTETLGKRPHRLIFGGKANRLTPEETILNSSKPVPAIQNAEPDERPRRR